jgi:homoserine O-acetyltransferase
MRYQRIAVVLVFLLGDCGLAAGDEHASPTPGEHILHKFNFATGEVQDVRMHYRTIGRPLKDEKGAVTNAVLILHGTTGSGENFLRPEFADELFGAGQPLDVSRYYLILPDNLGHGKSSKPSDGLGARFPRYGYRDMIAAQYRLLTEGLQVNHLRLVLGTSMGGMHTWLWGELHPDFMDALVPLACLPAQISGRNRMWRRLISDAIRTDPEWQGGAYSAQPRSLRLAAEMLALMSSNPRQRQKEAPTLESADKVLDEFVSRALKTMDANDVLYAIESSRDYDPGPSLEKITAPLLAINFADDLINPPELGILEREIQRVKRGQCIVIPTSERTRGHGTHTLAAVWKRHLIDFLDKSER